MTDTTTTLAPELAAQLDQLRDIHLPSDVSWWPPAPGWWVLAGVLIAIVMGIAIVGYLHRRSVRHRALVELDDLRRDQSLDEVMAAARVSVLLKRIVLQRDGTKWLGIEHGSGWAEHLSQGKCGMPGDMARFIALAPYAGVNLIEGAPDRALLFAVADRWIRENA